MAEQNSILERRRLRRKLSFWRVAALLVAVVAVVAAVGYFAGDAGTGGKRADHIARLDIEGVITDDEELLDRLETIAESARVKALIVRVNSPGGTTYGGESIYEAIRAVAEVKPVAAEIRTLGASAGYMIATAADHIIAGDASIVGSIGVIFQYAQVSELLERIGVSVEAIKSSPLKAEPSPFDPVSPAAEAMIRAMIMDSYDWFVDLVAERRPLSREEVMSLADGSIFTGRQAAENGLVDTLGGEPELREWLSGQGVAEGLEIVEWKADRDGARIVFSEAIVKLFEAFAGGAMPLGEELRALADRKLFLDGLVSVWQFGADSPQAE